MSIKCKNGGVPTEFPPSFEVFSSIDYPPIPTTEIDVSLQRYVDVAGSDSNDGQLVANGGTGAWQTIEFAITKLCESSTWKWLNLESNITTTTGKHFQLSGSGPGTPGAPAVVRSSPGNTYTFTVDNTLNIDGQENWLWHSFDIRGTATLALGLNIGTTHQTFRNITGISTATPTDNFSQIQALGYQADYFGMFNCDMTGPGTIADGINANAAAIYLRHIPHFRIENNRFANAPKPIYFKHANQTINDPSDWYIRNNWINDSAGSSHIAGRGGEMSNNVWDNSFSLTNGGGWEAPFNILMDHNTILGTLNIMDGDVATEINDMVALNSIMTSNYNIDQYGESLYVNTCTSNYNLVGVEFKFQGATYTLLSDWQNNSVPINQDMNSIKGLPTFEGGATPTTVAGHALTNLSAGYQACADGSDMGANTTIVGVK